MSQVVYPQTPQLLSNENLNDTNRPHYSFNSSASRTATGWAPPIGTEGATVGVWIPMPSGGGVGPVSTGDDGMRVSSSDARRTRNGMIAGIVLGLTCAVAVSASGRW